MKIINEHSININPMCNSPEDSFNLWLNRVWRYEKAGTEDQKRKKGKNCGNVNCCVICKEFIVFYLFITTYYYY